MSDIFRDVRNTHQTNTHTTMEEKKEKPFQILVVNLHYESILKENLKEEKINLGKRRKSFNTEIKRPICLVLVHRWRKGKLSP